MATPRPAARDTHAEDYATADPSARPVDLAVRALVDSVRPGEGQRSAPPLGETLVRRGALPPEALAEAEAARARTGTDLATYLRRTGLVDPGRLTDALGACHGMGRAGPLPRDQPGLDAWARDLPVALALRHRALPWCRIGGRSLFATVRPAAVGDLARDIPDTFGPCRFAVISEAAFDARLADLHGSALARAAECRVPERESCRRLTARRGAARLSLVAVAVLLTVLAFPAAALRWATALGLLVLLVNTGLRLAAWWAVRTAPPAPADPDPPSGTLPVITLLVPLRDEDGIAPSLVRRLARLDYPPELLDVCLVIEADDTRTAAALAAAELPPWMRVVPVPEGRPRTKPRALNYALALAHGEVVGIYDAEDAPAPDQLRRVAARFHAAPPEVACLQGRLDYYNPTRNWLARCFTIEYANWFHMVLPGIARLGLVVPLGGTTLFFRRTALEAVRAWDAHNVTEDADLGVRLARRGYRTEIVDTTTLEEAAAHPLTWVRQRSRWIKGYVLTWIVHASDGRQLRRDLGARRLLGFHLLFAGGVLNAVLAPVLWSSALILLGAPHPILAWMPGGAAWPLWAFYGAVMGANWALAMAGCRAPRHRRLRGWVPTMELYFPLATLAAAKAVAEIVLRPFHWDKTAHGAFGGREACPREDADGAQPDPWRDGSPIETPSRT